MEATAACMQNWLFGTPGGRQGGGPTRPEEKAHACCTATELRPDISVIPACSSGLTYFKKGNGCDAHVGIGFLALSEREREGG